MTQPPDWVTHTPQHPPVHKEPPLNYQWEQLSQDQIKILRQRLIEAIIQIVVQALTGLFIPTGNIGGAFSQLEDAFHNIPFLNVLGIGGPSNLGGSIQETWNNLISGLVGTLGSGAGLADLFNVGQEVSSNAALGGFSWDILGIRSNKPFWGGLLPTGVSNIPLPLHQSTAPTFPLTQSTATMAFHHIDEGSSKGVVSWTGSGTTNLTHFFVNIFKMATDGVMTLVHQSSNIIGDVNSVLGTNIYELPTPLAVTAGETYGIELATRGTGSHDVVGVQTWMPNHPTVFPRNLAAVRNSGTGAPPSTIASGSVSYSQNVPWVEFAVSGGDFNNHDPLLKQFLTAGSTTTPIPSWANRVEVIALGGGGGGHQGGTFGVSGEGGDGGHWTTTTWLRNTDYTGSPIITVTVGGGGSGGSGSGANGSTTAVSITGHTINATGGAGANSFEILGGGHNGKSPGNKVYVGQTYVGGGTQTSYGATGAGPGGGGAGGNWLTFSSGGTGAVGAAWLKFKQA